MDGTIANRENQLPRTPLVETVLNGIADWVSKYRDKVGFNNQLEKCGSDEVIRVAKDLGVPLRDLYELARNGSGSTELLQKMLVALHVDPEDFANTDQKIMRDLQRLCFTCSEKKRCKHELAVGKAGERFREFCPNAFTLDALFCQKGQSSRH